MRLNGVGWPSSPVLPKSCSMVRAGRRRRRWRARSRTAESSCGNWPRPWPPHEGEIHNLAAGTRRARAVLRAAVPEAIAGSRGAGSAVEHRNARSRVPGSLALARGGQDPGESAAQTVHRAHELARPARCTDRHRAATRGAETRRARAALAVGGARQHLAGPGSAGRYPSMVLGRRPGLLEAARPDGAARLRGHTLEGNAEPLHARRPGAHAGARAHGVQTARVVAAFRWGPLRARTV